MSDETPVDQPGGRMTRVRAAADKLKSAPSADLVALVREWQEAYQACSEQWGARWVSGRASMPQTDEERAVVMRADAAVAALLTYPLPAAPRVPDTPQGWTPLEATVDGHGLHIRIGIKSLANAVVLSDWAAPFHESAQDFQRTFAITDPAQFAREVLRALQREADDGSTPLTQLLDKAAREAIDDGADGCEFDCVIAHGQRDPRETWSSAPPQEPPR